MEKTDKIILTEDDIRKLKINVLLQAQKAEYID